MDTVIFISIVKFVVEIVLLRFVIEHRDTASPLLFYSTLTMTGIAISEPLAVVAAAIREFFREEQ